MAGGGLTLRTLQSRDLATVAGWIDSADALHQWSGPWDLTWPLSADQLEADLRRAGERRLVLAAVAGPELVGHAMLTVNHGHGLGMIGRVLVAPGRRGRGWGKELMRLVIALGFDDLGLHRLQLTVYAFNAPAISCYHSQGFSIEGTLRDSTRGSDGYWTSHIMGLLATDRFRRPAGAGDPLSSAPPGSPHIRPATLADAGPLARLLSELGYPHDGAAARARLSAWTDHADGAVLVADHDGDAVGFLAVCAYPFMQRGGRCARVMALAVAPEMRGHGLGHALMAAAMTWASERGCVAVEVTSSRTRVGAHAFYRRLGFDDLCWRSARFWRWLERDGAEPSPISPG